MKRIPPTAELFKDRKIPTYPARVMMITNDEYPNAAWVVKKILMEAQSSIHVAAYMLTNMTAISLLDRARARGMKVRVIMQRDESRSYLPLSLHECVHTCTSSTVMHAKMIVVDGALTICGSHNLTSAAFGNNIEFSTLIDSPSFAKKCVHWIEYEWRKGIAY